MNAVFGQFLDIYASFFYFLRYLVSAEALLVAALSGLCTALFSARWRQANVVANINLTFLAAIMVFPLTFALNESWRRREAALASISQLTARRATRAQACIIATVLMHRDLLDRTGTLSPSHFLRLEHTITELCEGMRLVLESPTTTHSRHYVTRWGLEEHLRVSKLKRVHYLRINAALSALSAATRDAIVAGTMEGKPPADGSRLAQFNRDLVAKWQDLRYMKVFRTSQTTRAFAHVVVFAHPFMMGPYYAWVAGPDRKYLGFAIFLAVATSLFLTGLLNARLVLEDPFIPDLSNPDIVPVERELKIVQMTVHSIVAGIVGHRGGAVDAEERAAGAAEEADEHALAVPPDAGGGDGGAAAAGGRGGALLSGSSLSDNTAMVAVGWGGKGGGGDGSVVTVHAPEAPVVLAAGMRRAAASGSPIFSPALQP